MSRKQEDKTEEWIKLTVSTYCVSGPGMQTHGPELEGKRQE